MDIILIVIVLTPAILFFSIRSARAGNHILHKRIQTVLIFLILIAVALFEIHIILSGGSGSLAKSSPYFEEQWFQYFLYFHILTAVLSYTGWTALAYFSSKNFTTRLPGDFSSNHRFWGKLIFFGVTITSLSGAMVYYLSFVA